MAYNFLGLVNQICHKVNEVPLTELNFGSAQGFYSVAKDAVNRAIKDINNSEDYWRFNYRERIILAEPGKPRYLTPTDNITVDFNTFRLGTNTHLASSSPINWWDSSLWADADTYTNVLDFAQEKELVFQTKQLKLIDYFHYNKMFSQNEFSSTSLSEPVFCVKTPSNYFILHPAPLDYHPVVFDYYTVGSDLFLPTDVPTIPEKYDFVVFTGAMRDVSSFREDDFNTEKYEVYFRNQIKEMRRREINLYAYVRSGHTVGGSQ